ncbi:MAG: hypothetical protein ACLGIJ_00685, partial [Candidatus Limnocylindria bacterium]
ALHADLVLLPAAIPRSAVPSRPRDFRLTPDDARRLGRTGWRRVLGLIGTPGDRVTRPLALGMTTLGLAAVMVASLPGGFMAGGAASAPAAEDHRLSQPAPAAGGGVPELNTMATGAETAGPDTAGNPDTPSWQEGSPDAGRANDPAATEELKAAIRDDATGLSVLLVLGGVLVILGMGLFGLRWSARRFGDG